MDSRNLGRAHFNALTMMKGRVYHDGIGLKTSRYAYSRHEDAREDAARAALENIFGIPTCEWRCSFVVQQGFDSMGYVKYSKFILYIVTNLSTERDFACNLGLSFGHLDYL